MEHEILGIYSFCAAATQILGGDGSQRFCNRESGVGWEKWVENETASDGCGVRHFERGWRRSGTRRDSLSTGTVKSLEQRREWDADEAKRRAKVIGRIVHA